MASAGRQGAPLVSVKRPRCVTLKQVQFLLCRPENRTEELAGAGGAAGGNRRRWESAVIRLVLPALEGEEKNPCSSCCDVRRCERRWHVRRCLLQSCTLSWRRWCCDHHEEMMVPRGPHFIWRRAGVWADLVHSISWKICRCHTCRCSRWDTQDLVLLCWKISSSA